MLIASQSTPRRAAFFLDFVEAPPAMWILLARSGSWGFYGLPVDIRSSVLEDPAAGDNARTGIQLVGIPPLTQQPPHNSGQLSYSTRSTSPLPTSSGSSSGAYSPHPSSRPRHIRDPWTDRMRGPELDQQVVLSVLPLLANRFRNHVQCQLRAAR